MVSGKHIGLVELAFIWVVKGVGMLTSFIE
jgi:hypothetical protein